VCPNDAISETDSVYAIDPDLCTECAGSFDEPQCIKVCPVDTIVSDPRHCESHDELLEKEKRILDKRDPYL
jgi:ferredoxin